jgi:VanZ family protein
VKRENPPGRLTRWTITAAYAALIFYVSMRPDFGPPLFAHSDKVAHFVLYAGLAFLVVWSLRVTVLRFWPHVPILAFGLAVVYGAINEVHQHFIPHREAEGLDMLANALGAVAGTVLAVHVARALERRRARRKLMSEGRCA